MTPRAWPPKLVLVSMAAVTGAQAAVPPPDAQARQDWAREHPVLRVAVDDQLGAEVRGGEGGSLVTQFMALAARRNGVRLEVVRTVSWDASVRAFQAHRVDVLPSMSDRLLSADVGRSALLSSPFYVGRTVIVARSVGPSSLDMWALKGHTVAFRGGGAYEAWLRREHPDIRALPLANIHQVLAAVESGIADAGLGADATYYPLIRRDYATSLRVAGNVTEMPVTMRVAVQRDEPELLAMVEASVGDLSPEDTSAMVERWLEAAYLRAPTVAQVLAAYGTEIGLAVALICVLCFALSQMRRAQLASRRGEQQKTLLLAVMSHEVRNAVNAVASSIELIAREPFDGPHRDLVAMAQSGSRNLQNLLKSALDFAQGEAGGFTPDLVPCDAYGVARDVIAGQRPAIDAKGIEARLEAPAGALPWLLVDETRLRQLLENLLGNAVKFTDRGHVGIALSHDALPGDGMRRLRIEVFDSGAGIPAAARRALFRPFAQVNPVRDKRLGGAGLGLAICREIVANLGGTLDLASVEGEGTTVWVELPTSLVPPAATEHAHDADPDESGARHALVVDDHPVNRGLMATQLRVLGFDPHPVALGEEAIAAFAPGRYEVVLLDAELPDMSGFDVAVQIRRMESTADLPPARLVAVSAHTGADHEARCVASGIDAVLAKPLSIETLRAGIAGEPMARMRAVFRSEALRDLADIEQAFSAGDMARTHRSLHRLQGAAMVCGLMPLVVRADALAAALRRDVPSGAEVRSLIEALRGDL